MRTAGRLKLGFFPLPAAEAQRLASHLSFPATQFSAVDPCVGDGTAFERILAGCDAYRYGIEIDADRAEQARTLGISVVQANTLDVHCAVDSLSLLYLNPPYDFEAGPANNRRLELVFLEHTFRWLKPSGALVMVIPQPQLRGCSRLLAEHFSAIRVYRLTEPACVQYRQVAVLALRRKRSERAGDASLLEYIQSLEQKSATMDLPPLPDSPEAKYPVPGSGPVALANRGIPLDEIEDLLPASAAYRQAGRVLIPKASRVRGRPVTPLHGGHVGLLCTAGMLNGVFGQGASRHIATWRSVKFVKHWEEREPNGTVVMRDREAFSHELTLVFSDGRTQILTHEKKETA